MALALQLFWMEFCKSIYNAEAIWFGIGSVRQVRIMTPGKNHLELFNMLNIKEFVACAVNPHVPGSSPGRGAGIF